PIVAMAKLESGSSVRYAKPVSHCCITYQAAAQASRFATMISAAYSFSTSFSSEPVVAPITLRMPISFVFWSALKDASPYRPRHAITIATKVNWYSMAENSASALNSLLYSSVKKVYVNGKAGLSSSHTARIPAIASRGAFLSILIDSIRGGRAGFCAISATGSISRNVGGLSSYVARMWASKPYNFLRAGSKKVMSKVPPVWKAAHRAEEYMKGMVSPATIFEELGFNYIG